MGRQVLDFLFLYDSIPAHKHGKHDHKDKPTKPTKIFNENIQPETTIFARKCPFLMKFSQEASTPHGYINMIQMINPSKQIEQKNKLEVLASLFHSKSHLREIFSFWYPTRDGISHDARCKVTHCSPVVLMYWIGRKKKMWKSNVIKKITLKKSEYFKTYSSLGNRHLNVLIQVGTVVKYGILFNLTFPLVR